MSNNEYAEQYRTALLTYAALTGENKDGLVAIVRTGLIAIATAPGTIEEKAKKTGVSQAKVGRDIITGLWLAAHPNEDAVKVKQVEPDKDGKVRHVERTPGNDAEEGHATEG